MYQRGEDGYQAGLRPGFAFSKRSRDSAGIEVSRFKARTNGYWQARAYGVLSPVRRLDLTLDVDNYFYDAAMNGHDRSHIVRVTAGYEVFRNAKVQGDLAVTVNPEFRQMVSGLVKFSYAFSELVY